MSQEAVPNTTNTPRGNVHPGNDGLPSINDVASLLPGKGNPAAPAPSAAPVAAPNQPPADPGPAAPENPGDPTADPNNPKAKDWERLTEMERDLFRTKEALRREREEIRREREAFNAENGDLQAQIKQLFGDNPENNDEDGNFDPQAYKEQLRKEIMDEVQGFHTKNEAQAAEDRQVTEFKTDIAKHVEDNLDKYPLIHGAGQGEYIFQTIEAKYQQDAEQYGHERAAEMMMSIEEAAGLTEKYLASEIDRMLSFKGTRDYLLAAVERIQTQPEGGNPPSEPNQSAPGNQLSLQPNTLNNNQFNQGGNPPAHPNEIGSDEEEFQKALSLVKRG